MKKLRTLILCAVSGAAATAGIVGYLVASRAHGEAASIGIIGSADGPTSILISSPGWERELAIGLAAVFAAVFTVVCAVRVVLKTIRNRGGKGKS